MREILQDVANNNGWAFEYGRQDYNNLEGQAGKDFYLYVDVPEESVLFDEYAVPIAHTYAGRFMLLKHSDFDRVYDSQMDGNADDGKYEMYIKPCKGEIMKVVEALCGDYNITSWRVLEVINQLSNNFDGVLVNYQITMNGYG
nr:hypothetical protein [uncultured Capnocytophaga sp.]